MNKTKITIGLVAMLIALVGCGAGMSEDEKEIAIAVALTQTAAAVEPAVDTTPTAAANAAEESSPVEPTATPLPSEPTSAPASAELPTETPVDVTAAENREATAPLTLDSLPVTQNSLKVRTLLVAPGEPGALYVLLTDEVDDMAPARNARFLISADFGASWNAAPSGLPVAEDCLYNI
ncbi:MAG: hypothetical protein KDE31_37205, partial [Caldilineaceae bacterium]|nr:hypothetical protein [Caldilineaceae bacterium]